MDPFAGIPNIGFPPGMGLNGMGMPVIIIRRKNLNNKRGSPIINPINIFQELDGIFESLFESLADSVINENSASASAKHNGQAKSGVSGSEDDHIELDQLDLSLNETDARMENNVQKLVNEHKENAAADNNNQKESGGVRSNSDFDSSIELKVEDFVDKNEKKLKNYGKTEE